MESHWLQQSLFQSEWAKPLWNNVKEKELWNDQGMPSAVLLAGLLFVVLINLNAYSRTVTGGKLPTVHSYLPFIGSVIEYHKNSHGLLSKCQDKYGSAFNMRVLWGTVTVLCDELGIKNTFRDKHKSLNTYYAHDVAHKGIGLVKNAAHLAVDRLFPIYAKHFASMDGMTAVAVAYNREALSLTTALAKELGDSTKVYPLREVFSKKIYFASCKSIFGERYPIENYSDYVIVDENFISVMTPIPFFGGKAKSARDRLKKSVEEYIAEVGKGSTLEGASEAMNEIYAAVKEQGLSPQDEAGIVLAGIWAVNSNTGNTLNSLFSFLLSDPKSFMMVRSEMDKVIESKYDGKIESLLAAPPTSLSSADFPLLESAVKETLRMIVLSLSPRQAHKDTTITYGDGSTVNIAKGQFIMLSLGGAHRGGSFVDGSKFSLTRYVAVDADGTDRRVPPFWGFGEGAHLCKGRYFALHEIKLFFILTAWYFDMVLVDSNGNPVRELPPFDPGNPGAIRPPKDLSVRLSKRKSPAGKV